MKKRLISIFLALLVLLTVSPTVFADSARKFVVSDKVSLDSKGYTVVEWEDSRNLGPYNVYYEFYSPEFVPQNRWRSATNVDAKTCAIKYLIPGEQYWVFIYDRSGNYASGLITVPKAGKVSSTRIVRTTLSPMYSQAGGDPKVLNNMSAAAMTRNMKDGYSYGMKYSTVFYSSGSKEIVHDALFAFYAPNGFVDTDVADDFTLPKMTNGTYSSDFIGSDFFDKLLETNGFIPAGTYHFKIYLEGRLFYSTTFKIND